MGLRVRRLKDDLGPSSLLQADHFATMRHVIRIELHPSNEGLILFRRESRLQLETQGFERAECLLAKFALGLALLRDRTLRVLVGSDEH